MSSPLVLHLIFCQIVSDMFNKFHTIHARIFADEREEMLDVSVKSTVLSIIRKNSLKCTKKEYFFFWFSFNHYKYIICVHMR